jgi:hypothetical protein
MIKTFLITMGVMGVFGAPVVTFTQDGEISGTTNPVISTKKIFPNDPDIPTGQPMWSEWDITTQLLNLKDSCKKIHDDIPKKTLTPVSVQYYYNDVDVSSCSEPGQTTCITRMYFSNELEQFGVVPYYVWYAFKNIGTFKKPIWEYEIWFNYNNTNTYKIGDTTVCDGKSHVYQLDSCVFTPELQSYDLSVYKFAFDVKCKLDKKTGYIDFNIDQITNNDKFELVSFTNWRPFTGIVTPTTDYKYDSTSDISGQLPGPESCKFC